MTTKKVLTYLFGQHTFYSGYEILVSEYSPPYQQNEQMFCLFATPLNWQLKTRTSCSPYSMVFSSLELSSMEEIVPMKTSHLHCIWSRLISNRQEVLCGLKTTSIWMAGCSVVTWVNKPFKNLHDKEGFEVLPGQNLLENVFIASSTSAVK